ncbi:MAG: TIGR04442 family protein [Nitrospiraceae bacterium]|nr:TIGR04442 family protein [Nitrospiraceae bacterium]
MIRDLRIHGSIGGVDYFTFVAGPCTYNSYFYEEEPSRTRFFSRGNEFSITETHLMYRGTGGSFCEYMFGVEKPVKDMAKTDLLNRLIMFGAFLDEREQVVFTNNTEGVETFARLFLQGHAVTNYYFIISSEFGGDYRRRQRQVLKAVGKFLKRTNLLADDRDTELLSNFCSSLNEEKSIIFIFKLVNRANQEYYETYSEMYATQRELSVQDEATLEKIVLKHNIDRYQQERMKIDIMYRHPDNRVVVDEYRDILLKGLTRDTLHASEYARLNRLRTLSIRNNIPVVLFDTLDELLLKGKIIQEIEEQDYLKDVRAILENLFFKDPSLKRHIITEDIVRLVRAKHMAYAQNERGFEQVLLDIGKACDDISRETDDFSIFEELSSIITYFDRYDNVHALLSQLAFMKNIDFREESLRSLIGNKKAFDELDPSLFSSVFVRDLLGNRYITSYGRQKIRLLLKGIDNVQQGEASLKDVTAGLRALNDEERLYHETHAALKERMRSFFPGLELKEVREKIRDDITAELSERGITGRLPEKLFEKVFIDLRKESVYLNQILPSVIQKRDSALREDFLENSGLDRFYLESLEKEYFEEKGLASSILESLREEKEPSKTGGDERI